MCSGLEDALDQCRARAEEEAQSARAERDRIARESAARAQAEREGDGASRPGVGATTAAVERPARWRRGSHFTEDEALARLDAIPEVAAFAAGVGAGWTYSVMGPQTRGERPRRRCAAGAANCQWEFAVGSDGPERWSRWNTFRVDAVTGDVMGLDAVEDRWYPVREFFERAELQRREFVREQSERRARASERLGSSTVADAQRVPPPASEPAALPSPQPHEPDLSAPATPPPTPPDLRPYRRDSPRSPGLGMALSIIPGLGQFYAARPGAGTAFLLTTAGLIGGGVLLGYGAQSTYAEYSAATSPSEADRLYGSTQAYWIGSVVTLGVAAGVWLWNLFDARGGVENWNDAHAGNAVE